MVDWMMLGVVIIGMVIAIILSALIIGIIFIKNPRLQRRSQSFFRPELWDALHGNNIDFDEHVREKKRHESNNNQKKAK